MKSRRASSKKGSVVRAFKTICWMGITLLGVKAQVEILASMGKS